jgi:hypothetical protein
MERLALWCVKWMLRRRLSLETRNALIIHILDNLGALPLHASIISSDGQMLVGGKPLEVEQARLLRDQATRVLENKAFELIREQVAFAAVAMGVHKAETPEQMYFARAALWWGQQEEEILKLLAYGDSSSGLL